MAGGLLRWPALPAAAAAMLYLALALWRIGAPGLDPEEMDLVLDHAAFVMPAALGPAEACARTHCLELSGRRLPLTEDSAYVGAVELYLQQPLFALLGVNVLALRLLPILVGAAALLSAWALCRRWFGAWVAGWAAALTASHPIYVHYARQGHAAEEVFPVGFLWVGLYAWTRGLEARARGRAALWLALGGLSFGLGLGHKITFLWYVAGLLAAGLALRRRLPAFLAPGAPALLAAGAGLCAGSLPLALFNLRGGGETLSLLWQALVRPLPKEGIVNLAYLPNLWVRATQCLRATLLGEFWGQAGFKGEPWGPQGYEVSFGAGLPLYGLTAAFLLGVPLLAAVALRARTETRRDAARGLLALYGVVFLCTPFTVSGHLPNHLTVLYPFVQIVAALALASLAARIGDRARWRRLPAVLGALLLAANLRLSLHFFSYTPPDRDVPALAPLLAPDPRDPAGRALRLAVPGGPPPAVAPRRPGL